MVLRGTLPLALQFGECGVVIRRIVVLARSRGSTLPRAFHFSPQFQHVFESVEIEGCVLRVSAGPFDETFAGFLCDIVWDLRFLYRSEEHTSELQSQSNLVCRLLLENKIDKIGSSYFFHLF